MSQEHLLASVYCVTGGNIASSWAVLQCMGQDGYLEIAKRLMTVASRMKDGINAIEVKLQVSRIFILILYYLFHK